jgi:uncharacterized DUF497 family protein
MFEWDEDKRRGNIAKHKVDFARLNEFDFATAVLADDTREDYGEVRTNAIGFLGAALYHLTYTMRGETVRVISLRKATRQEMKYYVDHI